MNYTVLYSKRKTISISVKNCEVIVKAPYLTNKEFIDRLVAKHGLWIDNQIKKQQKSIDFEQTLSEQDIKQLKKEAKE